jgi:hypothetical protein
MFLNRTNGAKQKRNPPRNPASPIYFAAKFSRQLCSRLEFVR